MPFTFTPLAGRLECSAFSAPLKALAVAPVSALLSEFEQLELPLQTFRSSRNETRYRSQ